MSAARVPSVAIREGLNGLWAMGTDPTLTSALQACHLRARAAPLCSPSSIALFASLLLAPTINASGVQRGAGKFSNPASVANVSGKSGSSIARHRPKRRTEVGAWMTTSLEVCSTSADVRGLLGLAPIVTRARPQRTVSIFFRGQPAKALPPVTALEPGRELLPNLRMVASDRTSPNCRRGVSLR